MTIPPAEDAADRSGVPWEDVISFHRQVRDRKEYLTRQQDAALADYKAMSRQARQQALLLEYCCRTNGCLLLHVWNDRQGRRYYQPRYRLSPKATEAESVESARQMHTSDGYRHWLERAGSFDGLLAQYGDGEYSDVAIDLICKHVRARVTVTRIAAEIDGAMPGEPARIKLPDDDTPKGLGGAYD